MSKKTCYSFFLIAVLFALSIFRSTHCQTTEYYRMVIVSDLHVPYKHTKKRTQHKLQKILAAKQKATEEINQWRDVSEVVLLGDIVAERGTAAEYDFAKKFLTRLQQPLSYVVGNHEYLYQDPGVISQPIIGTRKTQRLKLERFRTVFGIKDLYYSKRVGPYLLVYLSTECLEPRYTTEMSQPELEWLAAQLAQHPNVPTIVFFHAPLDKTLEKYNDRVNKPRTVAQPKKQLKALLRSNPQVFMWVSGIPILQLITPVSIRPSIFTMVGSSMSITVPLTRKLFGPIRCTSIPTGF